MSFGGSPAQWEELVSLRVLLLRPVRHICHVRPGFSVHRACYLALPHRFRWVIYFVYAVFHHIWAVAGNLLPQCCFHFWHGMSCLSLGLSLFKYYAWGKTKTEDWHFYVRQYTYLGHIKKVPVLVLDYTLQNQTLLTLMLLIRAFQPFDDPEPNGVEQAWLWSSQPTSKCEILANIVLPCLNEDYFQKRIWYWLSDNY